MKTSIILIGSAEEIQESINRVYIEPRNKVYTPEKDGFDIQVCIQILQKLFQMVPS